MESDAYQASFSCPRMPGPVTAGGYEKITGETGEPLYVVGDKAVSLEEAREYAQAEADALSAMGDPDAYGGYPGEIAPTEPRA